MAVLTSSSTAAVDEREPVTRRRATTFALIGLLGGLVLATAWSFELVDSVIGANVANNVLGHDAKQTAITGSLAGLLFAFVSGLAGTFTACNIAVFGALPDIAGGSRGGLLRATLAPVGRLAAGMLAVDVVYGFAAVLVGPGLPQISTATAGGVPVRLIQAAVVFGVIGLAFGYLGLAALDLVPDPFRDRPRARLYVLGALVGGFLIGRPYALFDKLLTYAIDQHNPFYGAVTFALQSLGNILVMAVVAVLLAVLSRGVFARWLASPGRAAAVTGVTLVLLGTFLLVYWDVRLPASFGHGWFPTMPWNA
jgi:hypothetical protein